MRLRRITPVGTWVRRMVGGALMLALAGLAAPATTPAMIDDGGHEIIEVEGEAPWWPPNWGGHTGGGAPNGSGGDGGGGSGGGGGGGSPYTPPVPTRPPFPTDLGAGPSMDQLEEIGFECNGPVAPAGIFVCHSCADTSSGEVCVCYDCQKTSKLCSSVYDCSARYAD